MFQKTATLLLSLLISAVCAAEQPAYLKLFIGTVDSFRDNQDSQYGAEYQWAEGLTRFNFQPFGGVMRTRDASHYLYGGFSRTSKFTHSDTGLAFTFSLGPGLYFHGGNEDTDLGHWFELRTSGGLLWEFADQTRIGLHFSHLSNASISDVNPGTELITLTYELAY